MNEQKINFYYFYNYILASRWITYDPEKKYDKPYTIKDTLKKF
jgi:hypothetical protein